MEISSSQQADVIIIALNGRLDGESSPSLEQVVSEHLDGGHTHFIFDCKLLNYVSSAGLRVFLLTSKKSKAAGGRVVFNSLQAGINEVFELSGFDQLFVSHPDLQTALADFT